MKIIEKSREVSGRGSGRGRRHRRGRGRGRGRRGSEVDDNRCLIAHNLSVSFGY